MDKKPIGIVTDNTTDFPKEIIDKYQIEIVSVKVDWPEVTNSPGENSFQKLREAKKMGIQTFPKTSQPSVKDFFLIDERIYSQKGLILKDN